MTRLKNTAYEWLIEWSDEHDDIIDSDHAEPGQLKTFLAQYTTTQRTRKSVRTNLALVRDVFEHGDLAERSWCYVTPHGTFNGGLCTAGGAEHALIPRRLCKELAESNDAARALLTKEATQ